MSSVNGSAPPGAGNAAIQGRSALARHLLAVSQLAREMAERVGSGQHDAQQAERELCLSVARHIYRERQRRDASLPRGLFGEPGWDMLLDLYIAWLEGHRVSVTGACIGAGVATSTGLRWLQQLERADLVEREGDERDGRRKFVRLTGAGQERITRFIMANPPCLPMDHVYPLHRCGEGGEDAAEDTGQCSGGAAEAESARPAG